LKSIFEHVLQESRPHAETVLADNPAHQANAARATPRLKQVKIVRSTGEDKESRAGRSKGFGFVELTQPSHALLALRYATNYIPDVWHRILPEVFGRRLKHGTKAAKDAVVLSKGKPIVPVIEFAIDKVAVLEKSGMASVPKKQQIHKAHKPRPTGKRPAGNKQHSKPKRQKK
jgi:RNA recognition motif-containing protein